MSRDESHESDPEENNEDSEDDHAEQYDEPLFDDAVPADEYDGDADDVRLRPLDVSDLDHVDWL